MTARGIHDHDEFKLGLAPHDKPASQLLEVRWAAGGPPTYPIAVDNMTGVTPGLDRNDELGDCGPTSADNHRRITTKKETGTQINTALSDVLELYAESTNPPFNPLTGANDSGVQMPDLLNAMRKFGVGTEKIVAFGRLRDTSDASIYAAISVFKAVLLAVDLQDAQKQQTNQGMWDFSPSSEWGGHAIAAGAYDAQAGVVEVFTWARRVKTTTAFRAHQLWEVWVPLYQSTIDDQNDAVDWQGMADAFKSLTGETLPGAAPAPQPTPTPTPVPQPPTPGDDAPFPGASPEVARHIFSTAARGKRSASEWMNNHFKHYFGL
jgi:hypothetical protein